MLASVRTAISLLAIFTLLLGLAYPTAVTGAAQALFPWRANGSILRSNGRAIGSETIGQSFRDPGHFWGRPSATSPSPYNAAASSGSNLGPTNPALVDAVRERAAALRAADPGNDAPVPIDLVTASGSGLDPHVSPAAAVYQARRVASARGLAEETVLTLIEEATEGVPGLFGERRVNVLRLNLALEGMAPDSRK